MPTTSTKALVVEDDAETRRLLASLLETRGCDVAVAIDGAEAIERLAADDYAVILLDIMLPRVSGTEVMEYLLRTKPKALSSVIVVTGLDVAEIRKLFPNVANALAKPVVARRLMVTVTECLERA